MLTDYIKAAMKRAKYKMIEDEHPFFGEIPPLKGVWANGATLEACRDELEDAIEDWLFFSIRRDLPIPVIDCMNLNEKFLPVWTRCVSKTHSTENKEH